MSDIDENVAQFIITNSKSYASMPVHYANKLYFLADTEEIYRGNALFTSSVIFYKDELPEEGALRKIYMNQSTFEGYSWTGSKWLKIIDHYDVVSEVNEDTDNKSLPNAKVIKTINSNMITDIRYNDENKSIEFTKGINNNIIPLTGLITSGEYDDATNKITLKNFDGDEVLSFKINKDNYLTGGYYDPATKNIILQMRTTDEEGNPFEIRIPAEGLVKVEISSVEGNLLKEYDDGYGVLLDISGKIDKVSEGLNGRVLTASEDGNANAVNMFLGSAHLSLTTSDDGRQHASPNLLATESAVYEYIKNINESIADINQYTITQIIDKEFPSTTKFPSESATVALYNDILDITNDITSKIDDINTTLSTQEATTKNLSTKIDELNTSVEEMKILTDKLEPMLDDITDIKETLTNHDLAIKNNSSNINTLSSSVNTLKTNLNNLKESFNTLNTSTNSSIETLNNSMEEVKNSMETIRTEWDLLEDNMNKSVDDISDRLSALESASAAVLTSAIEYYV